MPGPGAQERLDAARWLTEAAAAGAQRVRSKMARAIELAAVTGTTAVDQALGLAAIAGRFGGDDLPAILDHLSRSGPAGELVAANEAHSAQLGHRRLGCPRRHRAVTS
jgi:hypothetical protein